MQTMAWQEMGYSSGQTCLSDLLKGNTIKYSKNDLTIEIIGRKNDKGGAGRLCWMLRLIRLLL